MSRSMVLLLLVATIVSINAFPNSPEQLCGPNEVYTTCGTSCEPSCSNPAPDICTLNCVIGCQCINGYLRDSQKKCVSTQDCN